MTLQITINQTMKPKKRLLSHDQLPALLPGLTSWAGLKKGSDAPMAAGALDKQGSRGC